MMDPQAEVAPPGAAAEPPGDLSALAWVHDELRRTLEAAHKALRRHQRELTARAAGEPGREEPPAPTAVLQARSLIHQAVGALEMIGQPVAARFLAASEQAVQHLAASAATLEAGPFAEAVGTLERSSFALMDYLRHLLSAEPVSPLAMFPQFKATLVLAGAERVHPADLWAPPTQPPRALPPERVPALRPEPAVRSQIETSLLAAMRGDDGTAARQMSDLYAGLAAGAEPGLAPLWELAAGFFQAQAGGLLASDVYSKRTGSRLLAQLRAAERGAADAPERLVQDLQFFCARAAASPAAAERAPRVQRACDRFGLQPVPAFDEQHSPLGRFDPALLPLARRRVAAFKETWSAVSGGELALLPTAGEQVALVAESVRQLYPEGLRLAAALQVATGGVVASGQLPRPEMAMEVATALLCIDASLDEADLARPGLTERVHRLAERLDRAATGGAPEPVEPWMEALYREVSDRQTMGSVVQELRSSLAEVEQQLDRFNRAPTERDLLVPVPGQLAAMRGVLSVLGLGQASQAVLRMREDVDALLQPAAEILPERFDAALQRLADNLGGLSFLIDMLGVQPQLAKSLFRFDPASGRFSAVMGRVRSEPAPEPLSLQARTQALGEAARGEVLSDDALSHALESLTHEALAADERPLAKAAARAHAGLASAEEAETRRAVRAEFARAAAVFAAGGPPEEVLAPPRPAAVQPPAPAAPTAAAGPADEEGDMRSVFFEEAQEVLAEARQALSRLASAPADLEAITALRRGFHTLKGSARMVGLWAFGDAAWACEQLYNARLAEARVQADEPLCDFTEAALGELTRWVAYLAGGGADGTVPVDGPGLVQAAQRLREAGTQPLAAERPEAARPLLEPGIEPSADGPAAVPATAGEGGPAPSAAEEGVQSPASPPADEPLPSGLEPLPAPDILELPDWPDEPLQPEPAPEFELDLSPADAPVAELPPSATEESPAGTEAGVDFELDLGLDDVPADMPGASLRADPGTEEWLPESESEAEAEAEPELDPEPEPEPEPLPTARILAFDAPPVDEAERYKIVGPLRIPIALFNIYLNEADEQSRRLCTLLSEWQHELDRPVDEESESLAHSLAGNSATVGYRELSDLSRRLEHALGRARARRQGQPEEAALYAEVADEMRRLLHQFAAGFLRPVPPELLERLARHEAEEDGLPSAPGAQAALQVALGAVRFSPLAAPRRAPDPLPSRSTAADDGDLDDTLSEPLEAADAIDPELLAVFSEEAHELLPALTQQLRTWEAEPSGLGAGVAAMRLLHTLKGGARLAGAMRLGEMAHRLESAFEQVTARGEPDAPVLARLQAGVDLLEQEFQRLHQDAGPAVQAPADDTREAADATPAAQDRQALERLEDAVGGAPAGHESAAPLRQETVDWARLEAASRGAPLPAPAAPADTGGGGSVRVRAPLLDRMVSHAGEVGVARARIESDVGQMQLAMRELTDNLERLRRQLRDLELQAETQMSSRLEAARSAAQAFDPLEMDRYTRVQELTRMLAESVDDVGTVHRSLQQTLQSTEDQLALQGRLARDLRDDLLRARLLEFDTLSDRLYRVVRQAAKDTGKQVRLNIEGGHVELDRSVLDRMAPALEHLLRNAVAHGIEPAALREALGKPAVGQVDIGLRQVANEVQIEVRDDGAGLDLARIADRARAAGLLRADARPTEAELATLIFQPGFSTAEAVTELAGRGIGMDVVRAEVTALGGRIETASASGRGTAFRLLLPLTTAVSQVLVLACGALTLAVPATLVEQVRRVPLDELAGAYGSGVLAHGGHPLPFFWLGGLLGQEGPGPLEGRAAPVLVVRSASQRVALHVGQVVGNQEVLVRNLGPQLSRLPGLAGISLLASGETVLIYNPVALAAVYGNKARQGRAAIPQVMSPGTAPAVEPLAPLVLVVDDSLTVRKVTQRLLQREGYRVALAKDGLEALEALVAETPAVMLSDIEMPRMDGFDLVRNLRSDTRWQRLPVIMITSRIAEKHREHARELGVEHYLGKPYDEQTLLELIRTCSAPR